MIINLVKESGNQGIGPSPQTIVVMIVFIKYKPDVNPIHFRDQ